MTEPVLSLSELNRATLARQLLLERKRLPVARAVERIAAMQAQYSPSPYIGLWSRLQGFRKDQLTHALEQRRVVKASLFRGTLHLVAASVFPAFASVLINARRSGIPRLPAEKFDRLSERVASIARERALTHQQLAQLVPELEGMTWLTRTLAPLVHVPPSGTWRFHGRPELVHAETWLETALPDPTEGSAVLARRYLAAFGPAARQDLLRFAGVRVRDVEPGLDALEPEILRFRDEGGRELLDLRRAPRPGADAPAPVRLLPRWECAILAYDERERILPSAYREAVIKVNGDVLPTFLVSGFVGGLWRTERAKAKATIVLEPFEPLPRAVRDELVQEADALVRFVEDDADSFSIRVARPS